MFFNPRLSATPATGALRHPHLSMSATDADPPRDAGEAVVPTALSEHHVLVVEPPLKTFSPPDLLNPANRVAYDELADELVIVQGFTVQFSPLFLHQGKGGGLNRDNSEYATVEAGKTPIRGAKRSPGKAWLAVLKSDKEITFYAAATGAPAAGSSNSTPKRMHPVAAYTCKQAFQIGNALPGTGAKKQNIIKSFYWLSHNTILILASATIEIFLISSHAGAHDTASSPPPPDASGEKEQGGSARRGRGDGPPSPTSPPRPPPPAVLQKVRNYATTIDYYQYFGRHKVLLCIAKDKPQLIKTYKIGGNGVTRLTKIKVDDGLAKELPNDACVPVYSFAGERLPNHNLNIVRLYGHTCLLHLTVRQEMTIYKLQSPANAWEKIATLNLFERAPFSVNIVDNLILVHNLVNRITMVYDYRVSNNPIAAPIRMGFYSPGTDAVYHADPHLGSDDGFDPAGGPRSSTVGPSNTSLADIGGSKIMRLYDHREVTAVHPDKLLDLSGNLYALVVNHSALVPAFTPRSVLLNFLLQRRHSKVEVLRYLYQLCSDPATPVQTIYACFELVIAAMAKGMREQGMLRPGSFKHAVSAGGGGSLAQAPQASPDASPSTPARASASGSPGRDVDAGSAASTPLSSPAVSPRMRSASGDGPGFPNAGDADGSGFGPSLSTRERGNGAGCVLDCFAGDGGHRLRSTEGSKWPVYPYYTTAPGDWYTLSHILVVEQIDLYKAVFLKIHEEKPCPISAKKFSLIFLEYSRALSEHQIKLTDVLQRFLIDMLIYSNPPQYPTLHYFLQYHVIQDSIPIALQLLKFEDKYAFASHTLPSPTLPHLPAHRYPPSLQLSLDMLSREKAYAEIVEVLIARGHLVRAAEIMLQYKVTGVDLPFMLQKASESDDPLTLHSLAVLVKKYNSSVRNVRGFNDSERCPAFEEKYASVLGVPLS